MLKNLILATIAAAFLAAGPMALVMSETAAARTCKKDFITSWGKRSRTMSGARISARYAWKRASKRINGTKYDTWWPSKRKSMKCFTNRKGQKRCRARARACTIFQATLNRLLEKQKRTFRQIQYMLAKG